MKYFSPFMHPVMNISRIVRTLTEVKVLFNKLLSLTPNASKPVIKMTIKKANKSG